MDISNSEIRDPLVDKLFSWFYKSVKVTSCCLFAWKPQDNFILLFFQEKELGVSGETQTPTKFYVPYLIT